MATTYYKFINPAQGGSPYSGDTYYVAYPDTISANISYALFSSLTTSNPSWIWNFKSRNWTVQNLGTGYGGPIDYTMINNDLLAITSTSPQTYYVGFSIPINVTFFSKNSFWYTDGTLSNVSLREYDFPFFSGASVTSDTDNLTTGSDTNLYLRTTIDVQADYDHITNSGVTLYDFVNSSPVDTGEITPGVFVVPFSATSAISYYNSVVDAWISPYIECNDPSKVSSNNYYYTGSFPYGKGFDSIYGGECFTVNSAMGPFSGTPSSFYTNQIQTEYGDCPTCEASVDHLDLYYYQVSSDCSGNTITPALIFTATTSQIDGSPWGVQTNRYIKLNYTGGDVCITAEGGWLMVSAQTTNATLINIYDNCTNCANDVPISPTPTPTVTNTPTITPSNTPTNTPTQTVSVSPTNTPTSTITVTPTQTPTTTVTNTATNTPTPTVTDSQTPTPTPTITDTPTQTPTPTITDTPTQTPTPSITSTPGLSPSPTSTVTPTISDTPTNTPTTTITSTPTNTPSTTVTETPTNTPTPSITGTPTQTPTPSPTEPYDVYLFSACCDGSIFRFENVPGAFSVGQVYLFSDSLDFEGCAEVIPYSATGPIYSALGVTIMGPYGDCSTCEVVEPCPTSTPTPTQTQTPTLTPTPTNSPTPTITETPTSTPTNTPTISQTPSVTPSFACICKEYTLVNTSGTVVSLVQYVDCLNNDQQIELLPFESATVCSCQGTLIYPTEVTVTLDGDCFPSPSPTRTPNATPSPTPTVVPCTEDDFCLYTQLSSLQTYNGNYVSGGTYNSRPYFVGDGTTTGYIYYTGSYWCLSDSLGGTCYLQGGLPCNSPCPDISSNYFNAGPCPTPTPSPINCNSLDFEAYFDCDYVPYPTPTPSINCDLLDLNVTSFPVSPTPTPSTPTCDTSLSFTITGYTEPTASPTPSPTIQPTRTVDVGGQVTYRFIDNTFVCVGTKVLIDCASGLELYTSDSLVYNGVPLVAGTYFLGSVAGQSFCLQYLRDDDTFSSNISIDSVLNIYGNCTDCQVVLTPTPSVTPTNTPTPSITPTKTPTPSPTIDAPTLYYIFETCSLNVNGFPNTIISQTAPVSFPITIGETFKDSEGQCWRYAGSFTSYYPTGSSNFITYNTNYFNLNPTPVVYSNCELCTNGQPTPVNCVRYSEEIFRVGRPDGCGGYDAEESRVTVTLYDQSGNNVVNATTNITVVFNIQRDDCLGSVTESLNIVIPQGQSFGSGVYTSFNREICPVTALCDDVTKSVQGVDTITPSTVTQC